MNQKRMAASLFWTLGSSIRMTEGGGGVKATHANQYMRFYCHHPLNHKLGIIRTLYDWCDNIIMEEDEMAAEIIHVNKALGRCGYPQWSFRRVGIV